jgi:ferredoxin
MAAFMSNSNFVQKNNLFSFTATRCLRNEYFHNDCHICIDLCPKDAIRLVRNKLTVFDDKCVECAGCIGSCPTESFEIESFDPNEFAASYALNKTPTVSCKISTPCLGVFDVEHLLVMVLRSSENVVCDLTHCATCNLNDNGRMADVIRRHIDEANRFLMQIGVEKHINTIDVFEAEAPRRALFRKGLEKVKDTIGNESATLKSMTASHHAIVGMLMPLKRIMLKNSLKDYVGNMTESTFSDPSSLFFNKQINFDTCTNCGDCTQFCPTNALFASSDKQGIYFSQGKCIGCGICEDICKPNAITKKEEYDIISVAFDRAQQLVHYEMVMCNECRCPYPYKGGDPICDRCEGYKKEFGNMFTLARDM